MTPDPARDPCAAHACSLCCHDTAMPLHEEDAARLEALGHARTAFARVEDGWLLLRNERGACVFLRQGRCSVHAAKPEGCSLYPLVWYEDEGAAGDDDVCPWPREFPHGPAELRRLDALVATLVRERAVRRRVL
jgi:hypothetical protein